MNVILFGKEFKDHFFETIYKIFEKFNKNSVNVFIYKKLNDFIEQNLFFTPVSKKIFENINELPQNIDFIISIGGDGTFLHSVELFKNLEKPFVGINTGKLGFLATISKENVEFYLDKLIKGNYTICERTALEITIENLNLISNLALNELTVYKKDNSSMITIETLINDHYLTTYWSDGLIVSTPTGSTAYSLSAGGPIIMPTAHNFVITPLAPHTLTVRPLVVSDNDIIKIKVYGRSDKFIASIDSNIYFVDCGSEILVKKSNRVIKTIKFEPDEFFTILRKKLMWGIDVRN